MTSDEYKSKKNTVSLDNKNMSVLNTSVESKAEELAAAQLLVKM
jgi:hypothetical protein